MIYCSTGGCLNEANSFTKRDRKMSYPKITYYCAGHEKKVDPDKLIVPDKLRAGDPLYLLSHLLGFKMGKK